MTDAREKAIEAAWEAAGKYGVQLRENLIEDAIAAYEAALWQPIETAPKDGSFVIVASSDSSFGWVRGFARWASVAGIDGWISYGAFDPPGNLGLGHPTHWRPIPVPPTSGA